MNDHQFPPSRRRIIIIEEAPRLPAFMKRLALFCRAHALPLPMRFLDETVSRRGDPMAVYGCTDPRCRHREGWVQDFRSGRPRRIWEARRKPRKAAKGPFFITYDPFGE